MFPNFHRARNFQRQLLRRTRCRKYSCTFSIMPITGLDSGRRLLSNKRIGVCACVCDKIDNELQVKLLFRIFHRFSIFFFKYFFSTIKSFYRF